jgi:hypothetical protein
MNDVTGDLLTMFVTATQEKKAEALKILKGEAIIADPATCRPLTAPVLFRIGAAARFLGVSRATLWRMVKAKRLEKVDLSTGSYMVRRTDLEDLASGRSQDVTGTGEAVGGTSRRGRGRPRKDVPSSASTAHGRAGATSQDKSRRDCEALPGIVCDTGVPT